jgi:hypothetical protein
MYLFLTLKSLKCLILCYLMPYYGITANWWLKYWEVGLGFGFQKRTSECLMFYSTQITIFRLMPVFGNAWSRKSEACLYIGGGGISATFKLTDLLMTEQHLSQNGVFCYSFRLWNHGYAKFHVTKGLLVLSKTNCGHYMPNCCSIFSDSDV